VSPRPRLTVVMPVYNGAAFIAEALESVLAQGFGDFRLVVCDNCSSDETPEVVARFRDSRLAYHRNARNLGLVGNTNRCLELADTELVCIFHHDDVMLPGNLAEKVRLLDAHPEVGFVHSNLYVTGPDGAILREWHPESQRDHIEPGVTAFYRLITHLHRGCRIFIGAVVARRQCYQRLGGFRAELPYTSDSEMWMRLALHYDVGCLGAPLVTWRQHTGSASSTLPDHARFLEHHWRAARMILRERRQLIPRSSELRWTVPAAFAADVLALGRLAHFSGDRHLSARCVRLVGRIHPPAVGRPLFWWVVVRVIAGPHGAHLYHAARRVASTVRGPWQME
jgi:glycosyltransferase involved in cell wall biosynthesis